MENLPIDAIDLASRVFYSESEDKIYFGDPINGYFEAKPDLQVATIFSQHTESQTTGDTGTNLLQPDFGAAIFTPADMQAGSVYEGSLRLNILNNDTDTAKVISLFGIEIFNAKSNIPDINGRLTFKISFYNQVGDDVDYKLSCEFFSSGLTFFKDAEDTIDNTTSADIEFTVGGDVADIIKVNAPILERKIIKGIL